MLFCWCIYDLRRIREDIKSLTERIIKLEDKKFDNSISTSYNKEREDSIDRMIKMKLVYNPDTFEWDKLKELER